MGNSYTGFLDTAAQASDFNQLDFIIRQTMSRMATTTLVKVMKVNNTGAVAPVGFVDVQPMVHQVDGAGKAYPHGTIPNVPYLRMQGGANAIIMDPAVGDIGICCFASHDISTVKTTKAAGVPGSGARFDMSDGLYIGGVLNGTPQQYIQFDSSGNVTIKPASTVTVIGNVSIQGTLATTGAVTTQSTITATGNVTGAGISLNSHHHGGVATGTGNTGGPF